MHSQNCSLHIKFLDLDIRHKNPVIQSYFSITCYEKMYFSSVFDEQQTLDISCDIIIPLNDNLTPQIITLQRWQSHIIVYDFEIMLQQLKSKKTTIKNKLQTRKDQILTFTITLTQPEDIIVCPTLINRVSQHYLSLQSIRLKQQKNQQKRGDYGACYFQIQTQTSKFDIPVVNGNCLIYLPQSFKVTQYKNGKFFSKSKTFTFQQIHKCQDGIDLYNGSNDFTGKVTFQTKWIINQSNIEPVQNLLLNSLQLTIYDFELRLQIPNDFIGGKLRISCNNKIFQFNDELGNSKVIRIKRAIWILAKSEDDVIQIYIERNNKKLVKINLIVGELDYYSLLRPKHKLIDHNNPNKTLGTLKLSIQKSKDHSTYQNLQFWKQSSKKKNIQTSLKIQQVSVYYQQDERISLTIKTQNQQKRVSKLSNINFFEQQPLIYHNPVVISPNVQETIYFQLKKQITKFDPDSYDMDDFIGIGVIKPNDIRLGQSPMQLQVFKNQQKMASLNFLVTKYMPINYMKSIYSPQTLNYSKVTMVNINMSKMVLSPYFYSFKYDGQNQLFCIVQINRIKKVLFLQPTYQDLSFVSSFSSDVLQFQIETDDILKLKLTIMVGDGENQSIYGTCILTIKMQELRQKQQLSLKDLQIINHTQILVGNFTIQLNLLKEQNKKLDKSRSKEKLPFGSHKQSAVKRSSHKDNKSLSVIDNLNLQKRQRNRQSAQVRTIKQHIVTGRKHRQARHSQSRRNNHSFDHGASNGQSSVRFPTEQKSIHLPRISQKKIPKRKQSSISTDLFNAMNVRKRTIGGYDYKLPRQDKQMRQYNAPYSPINQKEREIQKELNYQNIRNSNPNIDRNFEILFPPKKSLTKQQQIKNELNKYEQKLNGLKSIMNQISNDIDPIEPTIKQGNNTDYLSRLDTNNFEFQGNQFV